MHPPIEQIKREGRKEHDRRNEKSGRVTEKAFESIRRPGLSVAFRPVGDQGRICQSGALVVRARACNSPAGPSILPLSVA